MLNSSDDDQAAPDSWELADLEDSMRRLLHNNKAAVAAVSSVSGEDLKSSIESAGADSSSSSSAAAVPSSSSSAEDQRLLERISHVDQFLRDAIQNPRERLSVLRMEQDVEKFLHNPRQQQLEFCQLPTSYLRLAAHRIAQHYGMQSSVAVDNNSLDGSTFMIIVRKTNQTRAPAIRLADIPVTLPQDEKINMFKVAIKQRPQKGSLSAGSIANMHSSNINHPKSVEERKEEYIKARNRIFSSSNSNSHSGSKSSEDSVSSVTHENYSSHDSAKPEEKSNVDEVRNTHSKGTSEGSSGNSRSNRNKGDREGNKTKNNRVAIFRDRETERKDPDYDRSYERYTQRFDPGFGFNVGPYSMQGLYAPAVNYNTEFPQLGGPHRAQMSIEPTPHPMAQQIRNPWVHSASSLGYSHLDTVMGPFNATHMAAPSGSALYMHSSQFSCPAPTMTFARPHEQIQQSLSHPSIQQQREACYNQARPH